MADTVLRKNTKGYNYKYTDLAEVNKYVEELGERYYQYTETTESGDDYIHTVRQMADGTQLDIRGVKVMSVPLANKANVAQEYGSGLTYARRYSLYMAYGLATEDDDAEAYTRQQKKQTTKSPAPKAEQKQEPKAEQKQERGVNDFTLEEKINAIKGLYDKMGEHQQTFLDTLMGDYSYSSIDEITEENVNDIGSLAKNIVMSVKPKE